MGVLRIPASTAAVSQMQYQGVSGDFFRALQKSELVEHVDYCNRRVLVNLKVADPYSHMCYKEIKGLEYPENLSSHERIEEVNHDIAFSIVNEFFFKPLEEDPFRAMKVVEESYKANYLVVRFMGIELEMHLQEDNKNLYLSHDYQFHVNLFVADVIQAFNDRLYELQVEETKKLSLYYSNPQTGRGEAPKACFTKFTALDPVRFLFPIPCFRLPCFMVRGFSLKSA